MVVKKAVGDVKKHKEWYTLDDIIKLMREVEFKSRGRLDTFVKHHDLKATKADCRKLFKIIRKRFTYQKDAFYQQVVLYPEAFYELKTGDCKSYSIFILSALYSMGFKSAVMRFTAYKKKIQHVYVIAILPDGEKIVIDATLYYFNYEEDFSSKLDFNMEYPTKQGLYSIDGVDDVYIDESILTSGGFDITELSKGEYNRMLLKERYSLVGKNYKDAPDFSSTAKLNDIPLISGSDSIGARKRREKRRKPRIKNRKTKKKNKPRKPKKNKKPREKGKLKKIILNWLFKKALPKAAPFFMFVFGGGLVGVALRRQKKQRKILNWISKKTGSSESALKNLIFNSIQKETGKTPVQIIDLAKKGHFDNPSVGSAAAIISIGSKAVKIVIQIINKIKSLRKDKDNTSVSADDGSDLSLLSTKKNKPHSNSSTSTNNSNSDSGDNEFNRSEEFPNKKTKSNRNQNNSKGEPEKDNTNMVVGVGVALAATALLLLRENSSN